MEEGPTSTPFMLSYCHKNVAMTYASSASTLLSAYVDFPSHHLRSTVDLIATPPTSSYPKEVSLDEGVWVGMDFSCLGDLETLFHFLEASNYCFGYSDSDGDDYDPSCLCFDLETNEVALADQGSVGPAERQNATPTPNGTHADDC